MHGNPGFRQTRTSQIVSPVNTASCADTPTLSSGAGRAGGTSGA